MRPMPPRSHTTMRRATRRASSAPGRHWRAARRVAPVARACVERTTRPRTATGRPPPTKVGPPATRTEPRAIRPTVEPTVVTHGAGWAAYADRAGVAGCADHDDVRLGGTQRGALEGVVAGAAGDCQVEHVDPVGHGLVDRGDEVCGGAAVVGGVGRTPAGLVGGDPGLRCDATELAGVAAVDADGHSRVPGSHGRHLGAVPERVEGGEGLGGADPVGAEAVDEPVGADDLATARVGRPPLGIGTGSGEALGVTAQARDLGEDGGVGSDAAVHHADDDAGAASQARSTGDESAGRARRSAGERADRVGLDGGHPRHPVERRDLRGSECGGEAVEGGGPPVDRRVRSERGQQRVLPGEELAVGRAAASGAGTVERDEGQRRLPGPCPGLGLRGDGGRQGEREGGDEAEQGAYGAACQRCLHRAPLPLSIAGPDLALPT